VDALGFPGADLHQWYDTDFGIGCSLLNTCYCHITPIQICSVQMFAHVHVSTCTSSRAYEAVVCARVQY
jgi:hypothetical protein